MSTVAPVTTEVIYPESDDEPMGETPIHRQQMADVIEMLGDRFAADDDVYISGNMMMYYVEGNPKKTVSPDVFLTRGIPKLPERRVYLTWVEGKGPDFVVEMHSRGTWRADVGWKLDLYRDVLRVREYFLFDPLEENPRTKALSGFRLTVDGQYEPIPEVDGRLVSEVLGLHLEADGERLRLYDPARGAYLMSPREVRAALIREVEARAEAQAQARREQARARREADARTAEEAARREADARAAAEEAARREADARATAEEAARREADARAEAAEAEMKRLRREIEELRRARPADG